MIRRSKIIVGFVAGTICWAAVAFAENPISAAEAKNHAGENATVCGEVVSTHYAERSRGNPTFINLDKPYPNQVFTILIWGSDRSKFGDAEEKYRGKQVCVTGTITMYRGSAEVVAHEPSQIKLR
jgi:DNA/RNA endonuclease YhcR with UshA esterase domain